MIEWTSQDAVIAVIGSIGVIATGVVLLYSFKRNRMGNRKWQ